MINSMLEKRVARLEAEVRSLKSTVVRKPAKKLYPGLEEALEDVRQGRVYGPFKTVKALRKSLQFRGA